MKEELQGKLVEILTSIQSAAGKASDFAMAELPDIAQSYIAYGRAYTTATAVVALLFFVLGFYVLHRVSKRVAEADLLYAAELAAKGSAYCSRRQYFEARDIAPFQYMPFFIGAMVGIMNMSQMLLVWFAPKVWLLKEIAGMLK
jgi:hypothetical protein